MNLFRKIWNGELPLYKVYWIYGVLVSVIIRLFVEVSFNFVSLDYASAFSYFLVAVVVPYQILVSVGVWRSATAYTRNKIWAVLAKIVAVLWVFVALGVAIQTYKGEINSVHELDETAKLLNKTLPSQIDKDTRLDSVDAKNGSFNLHYTLVNYSYSKELADVVQKNVKGGLVELACTTKELRHLLDKKISIVYIYSDKSGAEITKIVVDKTQCLY